MSAQHGLSRQSTLCPACGYPRSEHYDGMSDLAACRGVKIKRLEGEVGRLRSLVAPPICVCGATMYRETSEPTSTDYCADGGVPYWLCGDCGEALPL